MNHSGEALIGLAGTHGDALELLELLEEIFNEMAPFVFFGIVGDWGSTVGFGRNDRFDAALRQEIAQPIGIIGFVAKEGVETQAIDQGGYPGGFPRCPGINWKRTNCPSPSTRSWWSGRPGFCRLPDFESPFRALAVTVNSDNGAINHGVLEIRICG